jgi:hypothetical protein
MIKKPNKNYGKPADLLESFPANPKKEKLLPNFQKSCMNVCHSNRESVVHIFPTSNLVRKITMYLTSIHVLTISKYIIYIFIILTQSKSGT